MSTLDTVAMILVVVGAINWGLVGLLNLNIVEMILGMALAKIVYIVVGVAGVLVLWGWYSKK
ncbi:hypothetical protein A3F00_01350 [Candidatus Daviesbacteria bacterium RIFCSPHIGHO2_12_FULL_37_11]|uniref:DUF378 domain-containing protein n=1 Tax=Candidatus Daviesbacteria bacterium RIFCSPHIGHO2_12_FULL_37_11 TaxID=1797777 RepID=A0A1F5KD65_9BACT|nr:MAG: hypothetical protein A2111_03385 [Candidatus Daviesbacteria bacterium GWA1_38_6]OGE18085.1 MAG: hypothetical protein A2769_01230 [Candidatus Daviesbacteria bacterium RIFCSPHIGHO2_01_FULL_37_27]OGE38887.1 MAG: hypothetical protein A3F00_01350 [Candidatus Daviesbacteria bacterium RIFCSPHIGHO2_12_FULL_37_11]OGE44829.1 MAG: hypothetical protein A3B39_00235 [Candidatus Daviesbacteria bacterium RIFCSPLOWO2_01_FULL_37_10]